MICDKTKEEFCFKNVLITGASGGLGRCLALQLAHCGPKSMILSARSQTDLNQVASECQTISPTSAIHIILCDLADPASVQALGKLAVEKCNGAIDVLINNGGVSSRSRFVDTDIAVDERCMQINFLAGAALAKAVVPGMMNRAADGTSVAQKGRIIWISSVQGLVGIPNRSSYAASKFAVQGYCESLRAELAVEGIKVHCVSPGYIRTNLSMSALTGSGATHGVMDVTTAAGADPESVAVTILDKAVAGHSDFTVAAGFSAIAAIWMRLLCPGYLQKMLVSRYIKSVAKDKDA
jgi:dehydrogenase/reductase SDR family member 7B